MTIDEIIAVTNKFGFPIIAASGLGYFVYFTWKWATQEIKPVLGAAVATLIGLTDRVRLLDNDLIRLNQKVDVTLHLRGISVERERIEAGDQINKPPVD